MTHGWDRRFRYKSGIKITCHRGRGDKSQGQNYLLGNDWVARRRWAIIETSDTRTPSIFAFGNRSTSLGPHGNEYKLDIHARSSGADEINQRAVNAMSYSTTHEMQFYVPCRLASLRLTDYTSPANELYVG